MKKKNRHNTYAIALFIILLVFLLLSNAFLIQRLQANWLALLEIQKQNELELVGSAVESGLAQNHLKFAERVVQQWFEKSPEVLQIVITLVDEKVFTRFSRSETFEKALTIQFMGGRKGISAFHMRAELDTTLLQKSFALVAMWDIVLLNIASLVLCVFLWIFHKQLILRPMQQKQDELMSAKAALKKREAQTCAIVDAAADGIISFDEHGIIGTFNPAAESIFGYTDEDIINNPLIILMPKVEREKFSKQLSKYVSTGEKGILTQLFREGLRKNSSTFPVDMAVGEMWQGKRRVFTGVIRNVASWKMREENIESVSKALANANVTAVMMMDELESARDAAEAADRAKNEFLTNMSHEIRTPMNGMSGMLSLVLDMELGQQQRDYLETACQSAKLLQTLLNDVLDFAQANANKIHIQSVDFDLYLLLEELMELFSVQAQSKGIELATIFSSNVPKVVRGDPTRLRQIMAHLIGNALKFTRKGEVVVKVSIEKDTASSLYVHFDVTDTGIGIEKDSIPSIFTPFNQLDGSAIRNFGGAGLGLALCKQLVTLLGGSIGLQSKLGVGSTFWFTACLSQSTLSAQEEALRLGIGDVRVLLVDTFVYSRRIIERYLSSWGLRYVSIDSVDNVITQLQSACSENDEFHLVVFVTMAPGQAELELTAQIKNTQDFAKTRLIMLSSSAERGDGQRLREAGIFGFLTKPLRQTQLHDCIAVVMGLAAEDPDTLVNRHSLAEIQGHWRGRILLVENHSASHNVASTLIKHLGFSIDIALDGEEACTLLLEAKYDAVFIDCSLLDKKVVEIVAQIRGQNNAINEVAIIGFNTTIDSEQQYAVGMDHCITRPFTMEKLKSVLVQWVSVGIEEEEIPLHCLDNAAAQDGAGENPIDEQAFAALVDLLGDSLLEVISLFLERSQQILNDLKQAIFDGDMAAANHMVNQLKSMSANVAARSLCELAKELEMVSKNKQYEHTLVLFSLLEKACARTWHALEMRRSELSKVNME